MSSAAQWTDETDGRTGFVIKSIGDLEPNNGNFHDYNHKVIKMGINKDFLKDINIKWELTFIG